MLRFQGLLKHVQSVEFELQTITEQNTSPPTLQYLHYKLLLKCKSKIFQKILVNIQDGAFAAAASQASLTNNKKKIRSLYI